MGTRGEAGAENGSAATNRRPTRQRVFPIGTAFLVFCTTLNTIVGAVLCYRATGTVAWLRPFKWTPEGPYDSPPKWRRCGWDSEEEWICCPVLFRGREITSEESRRRIGQCKRIGPGKYLRQIERQDGTLQRTILTHDEYLAYIAGRQLSEEEKAKMKRDVRQAARHNAYYDWVCTPGTLLLLLLLPCTLGVVFNIFWHWRSRYRYAVWVMALLTIMNWVLAAL